MALIIVVKLPDNSYDKSLIMRLSQSYIKTCETFMIMYWPLGDCLNQIWFFLFVFVKAIYNLIKKFLHDKCLLL